MLNNKISALAALFIFAGAAFSCSQPQYRVEKITAEHIEVGPETPSDKEMEEFLKPYADSLSAVLDQTVAYSPEYLGKNDRNGALGAWLADLSIAEVEKYLKDKGINEQIHIALFNSGGVRTSMPQGDVKRSFIYELMPFENQYGLVRLKGQAMRDMFEYLAKDASRGVFHPLGGMCLVAEGGHWSRETTVGQWRLNPEREYTVLTTDFLLKGGDNMNFFADGTDVMATDLKMREAIMDYFSHTDTITIPKDLRYEIK